MAEIKSDKIVSRIDKHDVAIIIGLCKAVSHDNISIAWMMYRTMNDDCGLKKGFETFFDCYFTHKGDFAKISSSLKVLVPGEEIAELLIGAEWISQWFLKRAKESSVEVETTRG